jgi:hypothetical protein
MNLVLALLLMLFPARVPAAEATPEQAAEKAALAWLATVDAGQYGESWDQAAELFRKALTRPQWVEAVQKARAPLGKMISRKLRSVDYTRKTSEPSPGEYVVIEYDTDFANRNGAIERVTPMKDKDGVWRVSGYYIR